MVEIKQEIINIGCHSKGEYWTCMCDMPRSIGRTYRNIKRINLNGEYEMTHTIYPKYNLLDAHPPKDHYFICDIEGDYDDVFTCDTIEIGEEKRKKIK